MSVPIITSSGIEKANALTNVIESIALIEFSISNIIIAESEKIQAAVGALSTADKGLIASSITELLYVNTSVQNTIEQLMNLETLLKNKLSIALNDKS